VELTPHEIRNEVSIAKRSASKVAVAEGPDKATFVRSDLSKGAILVASIDPVKDTRHIEYNVLTIYPGQHNRLIEAVLVGG
jgi:hypothetical protein